MTVAEARPANAGAGGLLSRVGRLFLAAIGLLFRIVLVAWATLAIYYSSLPGEWLRAGLAVAFLLFSVWALWLTKRPHMSWAFAGMFPRTTVRGDPRWR